MAVGVHHNLQITGGGTSAAYVRVICTHIICVVGLRVQKVGLILIQSILEAGIFSFSFPGIALYLISQSLWRVFVETRGFIY